MAREFVAADSKYLMAGSACVTNYPFTFSAWFYANDLTSGVNRSIIGLGTDGSTGRHVIQADISGNIACSSNGDAATTATGGTLTADTWQNTVAVWASTTSRTCYLDGASSGGTDTDSTPFNTPDRTMIGTRINTTTGQYWDGLLAECAAWDIDLTATEAGILAKAFSPLLVRPQNLVGYWRVLGYADPESDIVGGRNMTLSATITTAVHPRVRYPRRG